MMLCSLVELYISILDTPIASVFMTENKDGSSSSYRHPGIFNRLHICISQRLCALFVIILLVLSNNCFWNIFYVDEVPILVRLYYHLLEINLNFCPFTNIVLTTWIRFKSQSYS